MLQWKNVVVIAVTKLVDESWIGATSVGAADWIIDILWNSGWLRAGARAREDW